MSKLFSIGRFHITLNIARRKTCWWRQDNKSIKFREDTLIGLHRIYLRDYRAYTYRLVLGRVRIEMAYT